MSTGGTPRFPLGRIVATQGAMSAFERTMELPDGYLDRHTSGDWGDLCGSDKALNDAAVMYGTRIFSAYQMGDGTKIWVITEWDRSATTILLPEEY